MDVCDKPGHESVENGFTLNGMNGQSEAGYDFVTIAQYRACVGRVAYPPAATAPLARFGPGVFHKRRRLAGCLSRTKLVQPIAPFTCESTFPERSLRNRMIGLAAGNMQPAGRLIQRRGYWARIAHARVSRLSLIGTPEHTEAGGRGRMSKIKSARRLERPSSLSRRRPFWYALSCQAAAGNWTADEACADPPAGAARERLRRSHAICFRELSATGPSRGSPPLERCSWPCYTNAPRLHFDGQHPKRVEADPP